MKLKIKALHPKAKIPSYANPGDAGMDLYSLEHYVIESGERALIATGIACQLPEGNVGLIWDKSSISTKKGLKVLAGVIDEGYRGEIKIGLVNLSKEVQVIEPGDKVAQMLIQKVEHASPVLVDSLDDTARGEKGFGSSGQK